MLSVSSRTGLFIWLTQLLLAPALSPSRVCSPQAESAWELQSVCSAPAGLCAGQQVLTLTDSLMTPISIRPGTLAGSGISASLLCGLPGSTRAALAFLPLLPGVFSLSSSRPSSRLRLSLTGGCSRGQVEAVARKDKDL